MPTLNAAHPTDETLADFARGRLSDPDITAVATHLDRCADCRRVVEAVPDDDFAAGWRDGITPTQPPPVNAPTPPPGATTAGLPVSVPAALRGHSRYRIERELGSGGMGVVYLAADADLNRKVALKVITPSLFDHPQVRDRFTREAQAVGRLDHRNIVRAFDVQRDGDTPYLVMEYVEGESLADHLKAGGRLPARTACSYAEQAAEALQHAHENGLAHRDVKPSNLMLVANTGRVKVMDFGLARPVEDGKAGDLTGAGAVLGTPDYIAPEQVRDAATVDIRADVYSLGCTLYHLLCGRPPFAGSALEKLLSHQSANPRPLRELVPDLPAGLDRVVAKMMAKDPAARYQTPREAAAALKPFVRPTPPAPPRRRRWVAAAAVLAGVLLAVEIIVTVRTSNGELVIESDDPDVEVVVKRGGEQVVIVDAKTQQRVELTAGKYEVSLGGKSDLVLDPSAFELKRGEKRVVRVTRRPPAPSQQPGPVDSPSAPSAPVAVGKPVKVNQRPGRHRDPQLAAGTAGNVLVVWENPEQDGDGWGIFARLFDAAGTSRGDEFVVNVTTLGEQKVPVVAATPDGGYVVAWLGNGTDGIGIYGRRLDPTGRPLGTEFRIDTTRGYHQSPVGLLVDRSGTALVSWYHRRTPWSLDDVHLQRFGRDGSRLGGELRLGISCHGNARVTLTPDGGFAVAWTQLLRAGSFALFACRYTREADPIGSLIHVAPGRSGNQIVGRGNGALDVRDDLQVCWRDDIVEAGMYHRRFDLTGNPTTPVSRIVPLGKGQEPRLAYFTHRVLAGDGSALALWPSCAPTAGDLMGLHLDRTGRRLGEPFRINPPDTKIDPYAIDAVAAVPTGSVVAWMQIATDTDRDIWFTTVPTPSDPR